MRPAQGQISDRCFTDIEVHGHKEEDVLWVHQRPEASEFEDLALFEGPLWRGMKGTSVSVTPRAKATRQPW